MTKLKKLKRKQGGKLIPTEGDLEMSARSLTNLLEVYKLEAREVVEGRLGGVDSGAPLQLEDVYYLASQAAQSKQHQVAVSLLREAIDIHRQRNSSQNHRLVTKMENLMFRQEQNLNKISGAKGRQGHVLGVVPAKTADYSKMTTEDDRINYDALCRGEDLLEPEVRRKLFCYYSTRSDLYYTLHPIAVEVVHPEPHQVLLFHHVLSEAEGEGVARLAGNIMKQSATGQ